MSGAVKTFALLPLFATFLEIVGYVASTEVLLKDEMASRLNSAGLDYESIDQSAEYAGRVAYDEQIRLENNAGTESDHLSEIKTCFESVVLDHWPGATLAERVRCFARREAYKALFAERRMFDRVD